MCNQYRRRHGQVYLKLPSIGKRRLLFLAWCVIALVIAEAASVPLLHVWRKSPHCVVCGWSLLIVAVEPTQDYRGKLVPVVCRACWGGMTPDARAAMTTRYLFGYFE